MSIDLTFTVVIYLIIGGILGMICEINGWTDFSGDFEFFIFAVFYPIILPVFGVYVLYKYVQIRSKK